MRYVNTLALTELVTAALDELDGRQPGGPDLGDAGQIDLPLCTLYRRKGGWETVWHAEGLYEEARSQYGYPPEVVVKPHG